MLEDPKIPTRLKLSALWTSVIFCYIYGDYFELYVPGKLQAMLEGKMALGAVTQGMLLGTAVLMAVPSVMVVLSLILPSGIARWSNVALGSVYTLIMLIILVGGAWTFYRFLAALESVLTFLIVWYAWRWPNQSVSAAPIAA